MRAVLTVVGNDKVGIIAEVSQKLSLLHINIVDVSQTIMGSNFTMMMMLELPKEGTDFEKVKRELAECGNSLGVKINIMREDIFNEMHKL